jgi:hypothetical protein
VIWTAVDPASVHGATWNPSIGIVIARRHLPEPHAALGLAELGDFAEQTPAILIGAWDDEGVIVWQPATVQ